MKNKTKTINFAKIKILDTVNFFTDELYLITANGVFKILIGSTEDEFLPFVNCLTFGTGKYYSSRKVNFAIKTLIKEGYLLNLFDRDNGSFYLKISEKGKMVLDEHFQRKNHVYKKKKSKESKNIVRM